MYSPKIAEAHIPRLHGLAEKMDMPMTKLVNYILCVAIEQLEEIEDWDEVIVVEPIQLAIRPEEVR